MFDSKTETNNLVNVDTIDVHDKRENHFKKKPKINVISKEEFEQRVEEVFNILWSTLAKSFGPYGAPTLILNYPYSHVTKDGYTIMKNLSMDTSETLVDQSIKDMAEDICGRLNYSVGDGTTTAVIATNSIYQSYRSLRDKLTKNFVLPRDVIKKYNVIKDKIIDGLQSHVKMIKSDDPNELYKNIYDVVYISSNADEQMTEYIASFYKELMFPAISCELAEDGITKARLIDGYRYDLILNDKLYVNSDDDVMRLSNADIVIFSIKITKDIYEKILQPLNMQSQLRGRHLIVAAPYYDETALNNIIKKDLNNEFRQKKDINMVLTTYKANSAHHRKLVEDFAVLTDTLVIDKPLCQDIFDTLDKGKAILNVINMDSRNIPDTKFLIFDPAGQAHLCTNSDVISEEYKMIPVEENAIRLGFVKSCSLGLKNSIFKDLIYDQERFNIIYKDAEQSLKETEAKYQKLGTFNIEVNMCQQRLYSLNLKMGIIEVGADSELSQKLLKDAVDDAIKAASSAYNHGTVLGCNTNLIQVIKKLYENETNEIDKVLLKILYDGFIDVYKTVLGNAFENFEVCKSAYDSYDEYDPIIDVNGILDYFYKHFTHSPIDDNQDLRDVLNGLVTSSSDKENFSFRIHDLLIEYGIHTNQVFDVSTFNYSTQVVNSAQTDEEILKATIDLITLLIIGNQMVVTQRHNF